MSYRQDILGAVLDIYMPRLRRGHGQRKIAIICTNPDHPDGRHLGAGLNCIT